MKRRTGDTVRIGGDYQYKALTEGRAVQRFWHHSKQQMIRRFLLPGPGDFVLDVGCGSGVVSDFLGRCGARVLAIDGNAEAIVFASRMFARAGVRFVRGLLDEAFQPGEAVDKVFALEIIEHVRRPQALQMLREFHRVLRPGGQVLITTPNYRSLWPLIEWLMDALRLAPPLLGDQHVEFYNPATLAALGREAGFRVRRVATACLLAPWLAPLHWRSAERTLQWEMNASVGAGSIVVCVLEKPRHGG